MTLSAGTRLGPYELSEMLGAGGMGEVYKARDTRLERNVAIKVLPAHLSSNPALRERFEREAKTISAITHPNICVLHDVGAELVGAPRRGAREEDETDHGRADGAPVLYLVMEYLEGESLAERLAKGPLPLEHVLRYGVEIASALDKAHRAGIIHRDLKPGNIMITKSGAKLLDFGLAKYAQSSQAIENLTSVPTEHKPLTQEGTILGTFQYMAPEQLAGEEADARTDIFALGAVLYEMLTGTRAFQGKNKTSLIGAIVSGEPRSVSALQPLTPPALEHVIKKCLAKDPDDRLQSAHDIAEELKWISEAGSQAGAAPIGLKRRSRERLIWGLCIAAVLAAVVFVNGYVRRTPPPQKVTRVTIMPPVDISITLAADLLGMELSPDGTRLAFGAVRDGKRSLWIRSFAEEDSYAIASTDGASYPFWSPDGRFIAFFADGKLKKVDLSGGAPRVIADAVSGRGGTWGSDGTILFVPNIDSGIYKVSSNGGETVAVIADRKDRIACRWPRFLPDGKHFLYVTTSRELHVGSLEGGASVKLATDASNAAYVDPGYLVYGRGNDLLAQPFDVKRLVTTGEAFALVPGKVRFYEPKVMSFFTVAGSALVYQRTREVPEQMAWYGRHGQHLETFGPEGTIPSAALSPDEKKIAFVRMSSPSGTGDIWLRDLPQNRDVRLTYVDGPFDRLSWSPDGEAIAFGYVAKSVADIYTAKLSGGPIQPIVETNSWKRNVSWFPHGKEIVFAEQDPVTDFDVWRWSFETRKREPLLKTPFYEGQVSVSPDGRMLAYASTESGRYEVHVRMLDGSERQFQISTSGGTFPFWRKDGRELIYVGVDRSVVAVPIRGGSAFEVGAGVRLFSLPEGALLMDATRDGERFLLTVRTQEPPVPAFDLILNWQAVLTSRSTGETR